MKQLGKIKKIIATGVDEYDFRMIYSEIFDPMHQNFPNSLEEIGKIWNEYDSEEDEYGCKISFNNGIFYHETVSGRKITYQNDKLTIHFGEGSYVFAYQWIAALSHGISMGKHAVSIEEV